MKLKEWGYTRHKRRKPRHMTPSGSIRDETGDETDDSAVHYDNGRDFSPSFLAIPFSEPCRTSPRVALLPSLGAWQHGANPNSNILMEMLHAVCESDATRLDQLCNSHPSLINYPIGLPFESHESRFFNHPILQSSVLTQHADQTLLDIAAGFPSTDIVFVLLTHGAQGSRHPTGIDLALENAIKNSRAYTVSALIDSTRSSVYGSHSTALQQAAFWNVPEIVRILIERGADVNAIAHSSPSPFQRVQSQTPLEIALERRATEYANPHVRALASESIKLLLSAGASIHPSRSQSTASPLLQNHNTNEPALLSADPFLTLLKPWQNNPLWATQLDHTELSNLQTFVSRGANTHAPFQVFTCPAPTAHTFIHQALWHSPDLISRLVIEADPRCRAGAGVLHELLAGCPDSKRELADTVRDVQILLRRGADPNAVDVAGTTPLTVVLRRSASQDIEALVQVLLDGGADPEARDQNGVSPIELAGRMYDESMAMRALEMMIKRFGGRMGRWAAGWFPIPRDPPFTLVSAYFEPAGAFAMNVSDVIPTDIARRFQKAVASVASMNLLDKRMARMSYPNSSPMMGTGETEEMGPLTAAEKEEVSKVLNLREQSGMSRDTFTQDSHRTGSNGRSTSSPPIDPLLQIQTTQHRHLIHPRTHHSPAQNSSPIHLPHSLSHPVASLPTFTSGSYIDEPLPVSVPVSVPILSLYTDDASTLTPVTASSEKGPGFRRSMSSTTSLESLSAVLTPVLTPTSMGMGLPLPMPGMGMGSSMGRWAKGDEDEYL